MADCPLADDCPSFTERIQGMGCQYYGDRGTKEWCNHYGQPIEDLKTAPVVPGDEVTVDVVDLHESGNGIGHTEDGFVVFVDGVLPEARARVRIDQVKRNYARANLVEKLPLEPDEDDESADDVQGDTEDDGDEEATATAESRHPRLGSREDFWGS